MKRAIRFTVMILAFSLCHAAAAQAYSIRVTFNTNLRAAPSLDSRVVESATAGSVLQVVDSFNRWLKVNRGGRDVWMASWVSHSRIAESSPSEPAAQVDNCCFVDRQCQSSKEWTDGYWAYQRKECPVGGSQPQISTPPTSAASSQVDNCCFVNRQCHSDQDWTDGYWAYQNNQCGAPGQSQTAPTASHGLPQPLPVTNATIALVTFDFNNCCYMDPGAWRCKSAEDWQRGYWEFQNHVCLHPAPIGTRPATVGNAKFAKLVDDALALIREHAPEWLNYIYSSGAHKFETRVGQRGGFYGDDWSIVHGWQQWENDDPNWHPDYDYKVGYAGGITHEACHAMQQRTHTHNLEGWRNEIHCVEAQIAVIEAINPHSHDLGWLRNTLANIQNPAYWWW